MGVYEKVGARRIINVAGASTRVGGALMSPEVVNAMSDAATESASLIELQSAASRLIAEVTGAEAGYVTSGAAAGLTLGTAAILAGLDLGKIEKLPETTDMKKEFIISRDHRNGYDHSIRLAGAKFIEVGMNEQVAGAGVRRTESWEYDVAVTDDTAGIAYVVKIDSQPPLAEVVKVAQRHNLPVLVDAAAALPPASNLKRFIDEGADLVTYSGGKAIRGPQATGIICGDRDLIASIAMQTLDMDEHFEIWDPPEEFIPKKNLPWIPRHGIGRGFKVSKEQIVGLMTALKIFVRNNGIFNIDEQNNYLHILTNGLRGLPVDSYIVPDGSGQSQLHILLDENSLGLSSFNVCHQLKRGDPGIFPNEMLLSQNTLIISPMNLNGETTELLLERLREILYKA